uniref:Glycoside hydrolase family 2 catalytic domain-containing protein n=1 Tax=Plectus sambesii TaxID=2011161 RepID=A0A914V247_9BILA
MGHLETIRSSLNYDLTQWHKKFNKSIIVTEYGADSAPGINHDPPVDFSESYQVELMRQTHLAFDDLRGEGIVVGEMVWNFADFMTAQSTTRVVGNRKGMLTRNRQPKMAAYLLKQR